MKNENLLGYFFESTLIPFCICQPDGNVQLAFPGSFAETFSTEFLKNCITDFSSQKRDILHPLILTFRSAFLFGIARYSDSEYLIFGPAISMKIEPKEILEFCRIAVRPDRVLDASSTIARTPLTSYRQFVSSMAVAIKLCADLEVRIEEVVLTNDTAIHKELDVELTQQLFDLRENMVPHTAYEFEQGMQAAVETGDAARLQAAVLKPVSGRVGQMSSNTLRQEKYTFIAGATLLSRAAVRGGLSYEAACSLSDIYCQQMDALQRLQDINALFFQMALEFCRQVHDCQGKPGVSKTVRECCDYISSHLHEEIQIDDLAQFIGFCGKTISQKFFAETGLSVTDYIHREKMREAAQLLEFSTHSISEISNYLQYSSQSYFSKIFKTQFGLTPKEYREHPPAKSKK